MKYINKDLIKTFQESESMTIAHQCNLTKGMGAGIAKYLSNNFKGLKECDENFRNAFSKKNDWLRIGSIEVEFCGGLYDIFDVSLETNKKIVNIYSQYYIGSPSESGFDNLTNRFKALEHSLSRLTKSDSCKEISIPLIASGLAKHKDYKHLADLEYFKKFIEPILKEIEILNNCNFTIYYL